MIKPIRILQVYVYKRTTMRKVLPLFGFVISLIPLFFAALFKAQHWFNDQTSTARQHLQDQQLPR